VRLSEVLQRAGIKQEAREVILEGADRGAIAELPRPAGEIHFARSLPLQKAMDDVLLAFEMNGEPLTPAHGFPLRAVVPGWYGMASIKWLQRIIVTDRPFHGYYETIDYASWRPDRCGPALVALSKMQVKAQISRPENGEVIPANANYLIKGAAWTCDAEITKVEVSESFGESWREATLEGNSVKNAWRFWRLEWKPAAGRYTLLARASDSRGRVQPVNRDPNNGTYMIHHCLPIEVEVR